MDRTQLQAFCDYMIGERVVGGSDPGDPVGTWHSPELRAFILARLGELTPGAGFHIVAWPGRKLREDWEQQRRAFAALLREVADGIDPPPTPDAA